MHSGCGCTAPVTTEPPAMLTKIPLPVISYEDTPVQYSEVDGITLGCREFSNKKTNLSS